jgi:hypothetical protein
LQLQASQPEATKPEGQAGQEPAAGPTENPPAQSSSQPSEGSHAEIPQAEPPQGESGKEQAAPQGSSELPAKPTKPKTPTSARRKSSRTHKKHTPADSTAASPSKVVVPNGGASDPTVQIAPSLTKQQASNQRQSVDQLLSSTDGKLRQLEGKQLNSSQQDMVKQAQVYMVDAKKAVAGGDLQRAQNLATKASLLADELNKH